MPRQPSKLLTKLKQFQRRTTRYSFKQNHDNMTLTQVENGVEPSTGEDVSGATNEGVGTGGEEAGAASFPKDVDEQTDEVTEEMDAASESGTQDPTIRETTESTLRSPRTTPLRRQLLLLLLVVVRMVSIQLFLIRMSLLKKNS